MMLFRTLLCLLSIAPATLIGTVVGSTLAPSQVLALNSAAPEKQLERQLEGQSKAANKDNEQLFEKLELNPSQIKKVRAIYEKYEPEIISRRQAIVAAKNEIKSLAIKQSLSPDPQLQAKQKKIDTLKQELAVIKNKYAAAMQAVLTTEQWSKLQQLRKER
jgi:Spy/CpxP family protein refolding chaperone